VEHVAPFRDDSSYLDTVRARINWAESLEVPEGVRVFGPETRCRALSGLAQILAGR
jgi:hypothetical protein